MSKKRKGAYNNPRTPINVKRDQEICRLRFEDGLTLKEIGLMFGVGLYRISRICHKHKDYKPHIQTPVIQVAKKHQNPVPSLVNGDSSVTIHLKTKSVAIEKFENMGFEVAIQHFHNPFNLLVNGKTVDVRHRTKRSYFEGRNDPWVFKVGLPEERFKTDHVVCITGENHWFVFPSSKFALFGRSLSFVFPPNPTAHTKSVWPSYLNRFDLLER